MDFLTTLFSSHESSRLLRESRARLYRVAYAWCHSPQLADDLVQETLVKAMRKRSQLRSEETRDAWLFRILANCFRDHLRRNREQDDVDEMEIPDLRTPEHVSHEQQVVRKVRDALARLPVGQRQVVTLVDLDGMSYLEVAAVLNVPIGTVMSRLCRARDQLKKLLAREMSIPAGEKNFRIRRIK
jgi:RNA polymerase sigma-70 factor (ECF subfamily)